MLFEDKKKEQKKSQDSASVTAMAGDPRQPVKVEGLAIEKMIDIRFHADTNRHAGVSGLLFTVHNRSAHKLNTVALNVFYDNSEGQMIAKETIHFNNIQAGATTSEHAPSNEHAASIRYKLVLINSDHVTYNPADQ